VMDRRHVAQVLACFYFLLMCGGSISADGSGGHGWRGLIALINNR